VTFDVLITDQADADLERIGLWLIGNRPAQYVRWREAFEAAVESLRTWPRRCPEAPESETLGRETRHLRFRDHRLLFTLVDSDGDGEDDTVVVLHVRHVARGPLGPTD